LDEANAKRLQLGTNLLEYLPGVYLLRQFSDTGPSRAISRASARQALAVFSKQARWTYKEFRDATSIRIITENACFPCRVWGTKRICYHQLAVRALLKSPPLQLSAVCDLVPGDDAPRGKPRRRKCGKYVGERLKFSQSAVPNEDGDSDGEELSQLRAETKILKKQGTLQTREDAKQKRRKVKPSEELKVPKPAKKPSFEDIFLGAVELPMPSEFQLTNNLGLVPHVHGMTNSWRESCAQVCYGNAVIQLLYPLR